MYATNRSGRFDENNQQVGRRVSYSNGDTTTYPTYVDAPFFGSYVNTQSAKDAYKRVLSDVGCTQPVFDDHDIRIINETRDSTFSARGSVSGKAGFPDNEQDVGGWENYPEEQRPADWDSDGDGLPNWWERIKRTDINSVPGDFSNTNSDPDRNGFTQLDDYLEFMGGAHYFTRSLRLLKIDLRKLTQGYTASPVFSLDKVKGNALQLLCVNGIVYHIALFEGITSFTFTVRDAEGSSMTRTVQIVTSNDPVLSGRETVLPSLFSSVTKNSRAQVNIWPNPARGRFNLSLTGVQGR